MTTQTQKLARRAAYKLARHKSRKFLKRPPVEAFEASWNELHRSRLYRLLIHIGQNPTTEFSYLYGRTFEFLSGRIPDFYKYFPISIADNFKQAIESPEPFLIVHLHDGHRFVSRVLADYRRQYTRIVANPTRRLSRVFDARGAETPRPHLVQDNVFSLVRFRRAAKSNHALCCQIDYENAKGERIYLNPAIFIFANRIKIPVFFIKSHVNDKGRGELISSGPHIGTDPLVCANEFLDFFNSSGNSRVNLTIKRYKEHRDWKKRSPVEAAKSTRTLNDSSNDASSS